jgi:hypothetical protein
MAWILQPHNYTQAIRPNYYRVAYRRTGAYKGMGVMVCPDPANADTCYDDGTLPCMPTGSVGPLQPGQTWCATATGIPPPYPYGTDPGVATLGNWVKQNPIPVIAGLVLVFLYLSPRR